METLFKLREWRKSDVESVAEYANNRKIFDNVRDAFPYPYTKEDAQRWINSHLKQSPATSFAIDVEGKAVGAIGIHLKEDVNRKNAELGYWLGEPYWNKGIVSAAIRQIVEYAFANFDIVRIYANVYSFNKPSMRVLEKSGFIQEAVLKKSIYKNGVLTDDYIFSILRNSIS